MKLQRGAARPWFRRRHVGLGWAPVSWQGWLTTLVAAALAVGVIVLLRHSQERIPALIAVAAGYVIVALATGGSRAGTAVLERAQVESGDGLAAQRALPAERRGAPPAARAPRSEPPAAVGPPALVVEHLTKRFGERVAVDDVSFTVAAGEVFGFLGPNGAGKTTTVRTLGTLISPTAGSAIVAGVPLAPANGREIRQRIAIMPESPGLYLRLTVTENLEFFAGLYGLRHPDERVRQALDVVNLGARAGDFCGALSKGLRQRVGLARTLLNDPAIVFLDEPTSGLDPVATHEVHDLIDRLRGSGVTVFLTTHRLEEAEQLCDRVAIMNTNLRTIGRPDELRDRLFAKTLLVRTAAPLPAPERQLAGVAGVEGWRADGPGSYALTVSDFRVAAPAVARALVASGADILSLAEARHSLEDVYLSLIDEDVEASR